MPLRLAFSSLLLISSLMNFVSAATEDVDSDGNPCISFGVDFQNGGSYFQNASSTNPFSFVSYFEGCETDICQNILIAPDETEYFCNDTSLTPPDTDEQSNCSIDKDQMYSGEWNILLLSNNGETGEPIAYQRSFYLDVAVPVTVTYTPSITLIATTTAIVNVTTTQTSLTVITDTATVTSTVRSGKHTRTHSPVVTVTNTITMATVSKTKWTAVPDVITDTIIEFCSIPEPQITADPTCQITPYLVSAAALYTSESSASVPPTASGSPTASINPTASAVARRRDIWRRVPADREARNAENKARAAEAHHFEKRGIDSATTTITDTNTNDFSTITDYITAATSTLLITTEETDTSYTTTTTTVLAGNYQATTTTAATRTKTKTRYTVATSTVATITKHPKVTVTVYTAPAESTDACTAAGGAMVPY